MSIHAALNHVTHYDDESFPLIFRELLNRSHYSFVYLCFIRLMQPYNENSVMRFAAIISEAFIGGY